MNLVERSLSEILSDLPENHPDRVKITGILEDAKSYNAQKRAEQTPQDVVKFTTEAKMVLEKEGLVVVNLTGKSIRDLRETGRPFWSTWHAQEQYTQFETMPSKLSEVAINPDPKKFFLDKSNRKSLEEQQKMVEDYSKKLSRKIAGVRAIIGEAPDYAELAFNYFDATGERLFGEKYQREGYWSYTRTVTKVGSGVADVGDFGADYGLDVFFWDPADRLDSLWVAPLIVPAGN